MGFGLAGGSLKSPLWWREAEQCQMKISSVSVGTVPVHEPGGEVFLGSHRLADPSRGISESRLPWKTCDQLFE